MNTKYSLWLMLLMIDFKAERNVLLRSAFPLLQQYCSKRGLDFQVVDLRWGVTDEVINDHQVSALCLREIATCQRLSVGPNFVVSHHVIMYDNVECCTQTYTNCLFFIVILYRFLCFPISQTLLYTYTYILIITIYNLTLACGMSNN